MLIYFLLFLFGFYLSFFLLKDDYKNSLRLYIFTERKSLLISLLISILPFFFYSPCYDLFFHLGIVTTIFTDCIDYSIFTIVPLLLIIKQIFFFIFYYQYMVMMNKIFFTVLIFIFYKLISYLYYRYFSNTQFGGGDVLFLLASYWYFEVIDLLVACYIASCYGILFLFIYNIFFNKKNEIMRKVPFIPLWYLAIHTILKTNIVKIVFLFLK